MGLRTWTSPRYSCCCYLRSCYIFLLIYFCTCSYPALPQHHSCAAQQCSTAVQHSSAAQQPTFPDNRASRCSPTSIASIYALFVQLRKQASLSWGVSYPYSNPLSLFAHCSRSTVVVPGTWHVVGHESRTELPAHVNTRYDSSQCNAKHENVEHTATRHIAEIK